MSVPSGDGPLSLTTNPPPTHRHKTWSDSCAETTQQLFQPKSLNSHLFPKQHCLRAICLHCSRGQTLLVIVAHLTNKTTKKMYLLCNSHTHHILLCSARKKKRIFNENMKTNIKILSFKHCAS